MLSVCILSGEGERPGINWSGDVAWEVRERRGDVPLGEVLRTEGC